MTQTFSVDRQSHHGEKEPENDYEGVHSYSVIVSDTEQVGEEPWGQAPRLLPTIYFNVFPRLPHRNTPTLPIP